MKPDFRLYCDVQATQGSAFGDRGVARYVAEHARALVGRDGLVSALGMSPLLPFPRALPQEIVASPLLGWTTAERIRRVAAEGPFAYHMMSPFEHAPLVQGLLAPHAVRRGIPLVVTLYDLIPLVMPERYLATHEASMRYRARVALVESADAILAISESTRRDAIRLLGVEPERVHTIGAGVSEFFRPPAPGERVGEHMARRLPRVRGPFVLAVSGADARKGTERLIEAYSMLERDTRAGLQLVVACKAPPPYLRSWTDAARACGLGSDEVVFTDRVSDEVLRDLYRSALLFVLASEYEGFGLPAAEAMACGCPAIASDTSSLPEVVEWDEARFDPRDAAAIASAMRRGVEDEAFRTTLRERAAGVAAAHSWERVAARTEAACASLSGGGLSPAAVWAAPPRALRVALAGPFPPLRSGIADYNARLARELGPLCDLDLFHAGGARQAGGEDQPGYRVEALGRTINPAAYDAVVYTLGNSDHHHATYEAALWHPGFLWLHDVRLPGMYLTYAMQRFAGEDGARDFMMDKLAAYAARVPGGMETRWSDLGEYLSLGLGMTRELVAAARGVVVNSQLALRLLALDQGPLAPLPPSAVIPLGVPEAGAPAAGALEPPVIASFGIGGYPKAPDVLVDALGMLPEGLEASLVFVGPVPDDVRSALLHQARRRGLSSRVTFTGEVDAREYRRWLSAATCAVQLRRFTNGECSAAVNDCLAAGLPVVTNVLSCRELPEGTVAFVGPDLMPERVAGALAAVLADSGARARLAEAGRRYAEATTMGEVARQLMDFLEGACAAPANGRLRAGPPARQ